MSIRDKIKHAGIWQTLSVLSVNILQLVYFSIMTRLLVKEDYGLMAVVNGIIGIGNIFIQGGMGTALIQKKKINDKHINGALQANILIGLIFFAFFYFFAPVVSSIYNDGRLDNLVKIASLNLVLLSLNNISLSILLKNYLFKFTSLVTIISTLVGFSVGIYLAIDGHGVWSLVIATLVTSLLNTVTFFIYAPIKISRKICYNEAKELFNFGSGVMLLSFGSFLSKNGLNLIFGKIFAQDILGVYERTSRIKDLPSQFLTNIIEKATFPAMSEIQEQNERLLVIYKFGLGFGCSIMIPLTVVLIFFSPEIVQILMGSEWTDAVLPLQIMFLVITFSNAGSITDSIIKAKGLVYKNVTRKYIFGVLIVVLSGLLGYFYGINGAAVGIVISHFINYLIMILLVIRIFGGSFKEYFYRPLIDGLKLGLYVGLLIVGYKYMFDFWGEPNIKLFVLFMVILILVLLIVIRLKINLLGYYLATTIENVWTKAKK